MVHGSFPDGELDEAAELGALTDRSVRLWVRAPHVEQVTARLEVDGQPPVEVVVGLSADSDWTGATEISLPAPAPIGRLPASSEGGGSLAGWPQPLRRMAGSVSGLAVAMSRSRSWMRPFA